jgi:hypothetical protein
VWKTREVFVQAKLGLAASAELVLGDNQLDGGGRFATHLGVALQVFFDPDGLPCLQPQLQVDVCQLDQNAATDRIAERQKIIDYRSRSPPPCILEPLDRVS